MLNEILPQINEANVAAIELEKKVEFKAETTKIMKPFFRSGNPVFMTDIRVKVIDYGNDCVYKWTVQQFQDRLYVIRDLLDDYFDSGVRPRFTPDKDPFIDSKKPILIGQCNLRLEHLGCQLENNADLQLINVDGSRMKDGQISVNYKPCNNKGETDFDKLPAEFAVDDPLDLEGKMGLNFIIYIE
jgi:hypothetical protein